MTPSGGEQRDMQDEMRQVIGRYLKNLPPHVLEVGKSPSVEVLELYHGAYNLNYHVKVDGGDYLFRVNIEQQSGMADQIEYEGRAIRFLDKHGIAPKCYYLDSTRKHIEHAIMIEEYLRGPYVSLVPEEMPAIAELLARLHMVRPVNVPLIIWANPLMDNYDMVYADLREYEGKRTRDAKIVTLTKQFMRQIRPKVSQYCGLYAPDGINHTDPALDNFIRTSEGLKLIDWEKPRWDDCTYDVACFLSEPCQLWCTTELLCPQGHEVLLDTYIRLSNRDPELFRRKVKIRTPLVSMHWILWGANRLCDARDNLMAVELQNLQGAKIPRWERIADPKNIEKLMESS